MSSQDYEKFFSLEEAREVLPEIRDMIVAANQDLENLADDLLEANERCDRLERRMKYADQNPDHPPANPLSAVSPDRMESVNARLAADPTALESEEGDDLASSYVESAEGLAILQENYITRLNYWIDKITEGGVILRDLRTGLIDFPARKGDLVYFLCWKLNEPDINYWHLPKDGIIGRRPLVVLTEY